jgi:uncharacterized protein DUF4258
MRSLNALNDMLANGEFEFSAHAFIRAVERNISDAEIRQAGVSAIILEEYLTDKYGPSCLLLGFTDRRRPLHIQVSLLENELVTHLTQTGIGDANCVRTERRIVKPVGKSGRARRTG